MSTIKRKNNTLSKIPKIEMKPPGFGTFLFTIVFFYILIRVIAYVNDTDPVVFTVEQSTYDTDFTATGLAVRNEKLISTSSGGTACYYVRDGEKVSKGANIFAIDNSGSMQAALGEIKDSDDSLLSASDYAQLESRLKMFTTGFSESGFGKVYTFKTSLDNKLMELYEEMALNKIVDGSSGGPSLISEKSPASGLITYYEDGYENINISSLSPSLFDRTTYSKKSLKTEGQLSAGAPVCKLVNDEEWKIAILLSKEEYIKITSDEYASFTINNSNVRISTTYEKIEKDDQYYIIVSFNKYIAQYVNERFLDINFLFDESSGLKIPASSIITKDAYMIPVEFLSGGSGDTDSHFNRETKDEKGNTVIEQIEPKIYFTDKKFCYVDSDDIASDAVLIKNDSTDTFNVATAAKYTLDGVLCVSRGTAQFRRVDIIVSGDDYSIVRPGTTYGISRYDRILLDGRSMKEGDVLY